MLSGAKNPLVLAGGGADADARAIWRPSPKNACWSVAFGAGPDGQPAPDFAGVIGLGINPKLKTGSTPLTC